MEGGRTAWVTGLLALGGTVFFALVLAFFAENDPDVFWHLKSGELIVANWQVPDHDIFSYTRQGLEWIDSQWLFQVMLYGSYSLFGDNGFTLLRMALSGLLIVFIIFSTPGKIPLGMRSLAGFMFLMAVKFRIMTRPELFTFLIMSVMFFVLERARRGRPALLALLPFIQLIFANSQGIWPIGVALVFACCGDHLFHSLDPEDYRSWARENLAWIVTPFIAAGVNIIQPYGLKGFFFPLTLLGKIMTEGTAQKSAIAEFQPLLNWNAPLTVPFIVLACATIVIAMLCGRKLRPFLFALGLFLSFLALKAVRNIGVGSVALTFVLMAHYQLLTEKRPTVFLSERLVRWSGILITISSLYLSVFTLSFPLRYWDQSYRKRGLGVYMCQHAPVEAVEFLKSIDYKGNIINSMNLGGYLIWAGWPDWMVFSDSRLEVGGQDVFRHYWRVYQNNKLFEARAREYDVGAVVLTWFHPYSDTCAMLMNDKRWALVHIDCTALVFLRREPRYESIIREYEITDPLEYEIISPEKNRIP